MLSLRRLKADDSDLDVIVDDLNSANWSDFDDKFTVESLKKFLEADDRIYLVGHLDSKLAGAVHAYKLQHPSGKVHIYIDEVDTAKPYRRKGVATAMMKEMLKISRKEYNADEVWLGTEHDNEPAKALYRSLSPDEEENGPIYSYKIKK